MSQVHCGAAGKVDPSDPSELVSRHDDALPVLPGVERLLLLTSQDRIQNSRPGRKR